MTATSHVGARQRIARACYGLIALVVVAALTIQLVLLLTGGADGGLRIGRRTVVVAKASPGL